MGDITVDVTPVGEVAFKKRFSYGLYDRKTVAT
jgi:hypothetical protein